MIYVERENIIYIYGGKALNHGNLEIINDLWKINMD